MTYVLQQVLNGLQLGSVYALIALGYTMVYGILSLINFAHGDLFMLGAFVVFAAATMAHLPFIPALLIAMGLVALLGALIERLAYRPLRRAPKMSAVITALGVGLILEHLTLVFNPYPRNLPPLVTNVSWSFGGVVFSSIQIMIIGLSLVLMVGLDLFVKYTRTGMAMRAISWNIHAARLVGVPVERVISLTFALGAGLGAAAGAMYAVAYPVIDPYMGVLIGWKAFIAAVVGGIGNIRGAVAGGFILGALEIGVTTVLPSTYRDFVAFALLLAFLLIKPSGIWGSVRVEKV